MAAQKGRGFLIKVGDGATAESFTTVAGLRTTSMALNGELVDVTSKDDDGWRVLLSDAAFLSATFSGSGVFKDTASEETIRANFVAQTVDNYQVVFDSGDMWEGGFQVSNLEFTGEFNGAVEFSVTFESSGTLTFTPGA